MSSWSFHLIFKTVIITCVTMGACVCAHEYRVSGKGQERTVGLLEMELQVAVLCSMWVLGTKLWSS